MLKVMSGVPPLGIIIQPAFLNLRPDRCSLSNHPLPPRAVRRVSKAAALLTGQPAPAGEGGQRPTKASRRPSGKPFELRRSFAKVTIPSFKPVDAGVGPRIPSENAQCEG